MVDFEYDMTTWKASATFCQQCRDTLIVEVGGQLLDNSLCFFSSCILQPPFPASGLHTGTHGRKPKSGVEVELKSGRPWVFVPSTVCLQQSAASGLMFPTGMACHSSIAN